MLSKVENSKFSATVNVFLNKSYPQILVCIIALVLANECAK